jgi:uncharacterized protein YeaO (DUF488 family)
MMIPAAGLSEAETGAAALRGTAEDDRHATIVHHGEHTMTVRIVRLGTDRAAGEGTRIGTVRRPPRGVPKAEFAKQNWYDVWYPTLAPSVETMKLGQAAETPAQWAAFARKYRSEMGQPDAAHAIDLLAVLSRHADFSVGCYCEDESHCHRGILRALLAERGAQIA